MRRLTSVLKGAALLLALAFFVLFPGWSPQTVQAQLSNQGIYLVPPTACGQLVSGNSTGTQGYQVSGSSNTWVQQSQTSATGVNTHTYICDITPAGSRIGGGAVTAITKVTFFYGLTNQLGSQTSTVASGTFNAAIVFSKIVLPAPGASETPSTVLPVRADTGTLLITPGSSTFNTTTSGAGTFYTVTFTPATAIPIADLTKYLLTVTLQGLQDTPLTTFTPGAIVYTR